MKTGGEDFCLFSVKICSVYLTITKARIVIPKLKRIIYIKLSEAAIRRCSSK